MIHSFIWICIRQNNALCIQISTKRLYLLQRVVWWAGQILPQDWMTYSPRNWKSANSSHISGLSINFPPLEKAASTKTSPDSWGSFHPGPSPHHRLLRNVISTSEQHVGLDATFNQAASGLNSPGWILLPFLLFCGRWPQGQFIKVSPGLSSCQNLLPREPNLKLPSSKLSLVLFFWYGLK